MSATATRKGGLGIVIAGVLSLAVGAGGAFTAVRSGLVPLDGLLGGAGDSRPSTEAEWVAPTFVPVAPLVISLGPEAGARHLRVVLELEVNPRAASAVEQAVPRVLDVLNTFLRAVDERDLELPSAMARLRAQMLRRVQLVTPPGAVHDILIQEFVLN